MTNNKKCEWCSKPFFVQKNLKQTRYCESCKTIPPYKKYTIRHKKRSTESQKRYRMRNKQLCTQRTVKSNRKIRQKYREAVYNHYGSFCKCCGESQKMFLTIDHIGGGGRKHRLTVNNMSGGISGWIVKNNFPDNFQILCMNCNLGKYRNGGTCPHKDI